MKTTKFQLLDDLKSRSERFLVTVETLISSLSPVQIQTNPQPASWSVAQVIQHLLLSHQGYVRAIELRLAGAIPSPSDASYSPGLLGGIMIKAIAPSPGKKIRRAPAPKSMVPSGNVSDFIPIFQDFISLQKQLESLISRSLDYDIARLRVPLSVFPLIRLPLVDVFQIITVHNERHLLQLQRIKNSVE